MCNKTLRPSVARDYLICPLHEQHACTNQDSSWSHYNAPAILYIIVKLCLCVCRQPPCPHRIIQGYQIWHSTRLYEISKEFQNFHGRGRARSSFFSIAMDHMASQGSFVFLASKFISVVSQMATRVPGKNQAARQVLYVS